MKLAHFYLNFPGNAEEAFGHYAAVFGTQVVGRVTFGDAPFVQNAPEQARAKLMHIQLPLTDTVHLMGSDVVEGMGPPVKFGDNHWVSVVAETQAEADRVFAGLAEGGTITMPLANAPWGPYFGMVRDRFGVGWMVSLTGPA